VIRQILIHVTGVNCEGCHKLIKVEETKPGVYKIQGEIYRSIC